MLKKFWNFTFLGLIGLIIILIKKIYVVFFDKISTLGFKYNILKCGKNVIVRRGLIYRFPNSITVSDNVEIGEYVSLTSELLYGKLEFHKNVVIGRYSKLDFSGGIIIDENTLLSENVTIQTHDHGLNPRSEPVGKAIYIGKNVWVGMNTLILYNCSKIGENSIIGAGSIVTGDIEPNSIYVGNPARLLKKI